MHLPVLFCVILKIIFCTKTEHAQSEKLIMKEERRYINLSKIAEPAPTNLTESNFTQNDCNPATRLQQLHVTHIYVGMLFIFFLIFCCIMLAK